MLKGTVVSDTLLYGPDEFGHFKTVIVKGIHTRGVPVAATHAGQSASFNIKATLGKSNKVERQNIRKGQVLLKAVEGKAVRAFKAEVVFCIIQPQYKLTINLSFIRVVLAVCPRLFNG